MSIFIVTKQSDLWPWSNFKEDYIFKINNELLANCIGIGSGASRASGTVSGFNFGKQTGYALLTYFVSVALGFRRFPFCEDRIYIKYIGRESNESKSILSYLTDEKISEIVTETKKLYEHTQHQLKRVGVSKINLRREIGSNGNGYAETIMKLIDCAKLLGRKSIQFEIDTLNSFGDQNAYKHLADVTIEHTFKAEDIIYCSNLIGRDGENLVESGEWVVINRSPTGVIDLPIESIKYDTANWNESVLNTESAIKFMANYSPFFIRNFPVNFYEEPTYGPQGKYCSFRKRLAKWLLSNNNIFE